MPSIKTYRIVTLSTSTPYNFVTGTTATSTSNPVAANKGVTVNFQNQSTASTDVYIGGSDLTISIGATSTTGTGGIKLAQNGSYTIEPRHAPSAIIMDDWYVISTSSNAICVGQVVRMV